MRQRSSSQIKKGLETFEDDPNVAVVGQVLVDDVVHVEGDAVVEAYSFGHSHIDSKEVVISMDCHIGQPADPLSSIAAMHHERLVSNVNLIC